MKKLNPLNAFEKKFENKRATLFKASLPKIGDYLERETLAWAKRNEYYQEPKKELSRKAQELCLLITTGEPFGCKTDAVLRVMSILLEEDLLSPSGKTIKFDDGDYVVVPTAYPNSDEDYLLDCPYLSGGEKIRRAHV